VDAHVDEGVDVPEEGSGKMVREARVVLSSEHHAKMLAERTRASCWLVIAPPRFPVGKVRWRSLHETTAGRDLRGGPERASKAEEEKAFAGHTRPSEGAAARLVGVACARVVSGLTLPLSH